MRPEALSEDLRRGSGPYLQQRRAIIGLKYLGAALLRIVALSQTGVIPHLPDPPFKLFNSDKVDASREAYKLLDVPDAALGITNACLTLSLAAIGSQDRCRTKPWLPLLLAGKIMMDVSQAGRLFINQLTKQHALCFYCTVAAFSSFATAPLVFGEAWTAIQHLRGADSPAQRLPQRIA